MSAENRAVVSRFYEVFKEGDLSILDEVLAGNFVEHNPFPEQPAGPEGMKHIVMMMRAGFPDSGISVKDMVAEGDKVAVRAELTGSHGGEFMGILATGNRVQVTGISIYTVSDGKITEHWEQFDGMAMMQQLGAIPSE